MFQCPYLLMKKTAPTCGCVARLHVVSVIHFRHQNAGTGEARRSNAHISRTAGAGAGRRANKHVGTPVWARFGRLTARDCVAPSEERDTCIGATPLSVSCGRPDAAHA